MTLQLRPLQPSDAPALAKLANNKKIWNHVRDRMPFPYTQQDAATFIGNVQQSERALVRAILWPNAGFVGTVGLHFREAPYDGSAELAYWIGEPYWGCGIASSAVQKVLALGFARSELRRIYATVFSFNRSSARVLERNGFRQEVVARAAILKNNQVWDEITFGLLRAEYGALQVLPDYPHLKRPSNTVRNVIG
ncbi:MAG: GNAT family N-acetyltransferase [Bacteroidota bacterium]